MTPDRPQRVVLVEDNQHWRDALRRLVRAAGHDTVHESTTADDAIAWLQRHPHDWDLALIDAFLAKGNGFAVLKACTPKRPTQRVVMVSNFDRSEAREQAVRLGADRFFDKATEMDALTDYCFGL